MARFGFEDELGEIAHALRIEHAVQMVAFMLHDAGVKALGRALDQLAPNVKTAIADMRRPLHQPAQFGNREAALPAGLDLQAHDLDFGIDEDCEGCCAVESLGLGKVGLAAAGRLKHNDPERHMDLGRGQPGAIGVHHGVHHIGHKPGDFRCRWVIHGSGPGGKDGVAHAGDFENSHVLNMGWACRAVKVRLAARVDRVKPFCYLARPHANGLQEQTLQIIVRDNNIDQALKALKKKMQREGIFREMKLRGHYEKPSEKRARERAEAIRRYRKLQRKRLQREGVLPK